MDNLQTSAGCWSYNQSPVADLGLDPSQSFPCWPKCAQEAWTSPGTSVPPYRAAFFQAECLNYIFEQEVLKSQEAMSLWLVQLWHVANRLQTQACHSNICKMNERANKQLNEEIPLWHSLMAVGILNSPSHTNQGCMEEPSFGSELGWYFH